MEDEIYATFTAFKVMQHVCDVYISVDTSGVVYIPALVNLKHIFDVHMYILVLYCIVSHNSASIQCDTYFIYARNDVVIL